VGVAGVDGAGVAGVAGAGVDGVGVDGAVGATDVGGVDGRVDRLSTGGEAVLAVRWSRAVSAPPATADSSPTTMHMAMRAI
jgi:hypothetical protein